MKAEFVWAKKMPKQKSSLAKCSPNKPKANNKNFTHTRKKIKLFSLYCVVFFVQFFSFCGCGFCFFAYDELDFVWGRRRVFFINTNAIRVLRNGNKCGVFSIKRS